MMCFLDYLALGCCLALNTVNKSSIFYFLHESHN